jgi:hypothetical protein
MAKIFSNVPGRIKAMFRGRGNVLGKAGPISHGVAGM